jgi:hypothetical protein
MHHLIGSGSVADLLSSSTATADYLDPWCDLCERPGHSTSMCGEVQDAELWNGDAL